METGCCHAALRHKLKVPRETLRSAYHHGNLHDAVVRAARTVVDTNGVEALSLRAIGQSLGVTHSALYRHFASRDALAAAVASGGFDELFQAMRTAVLSGDEECRAERAMAAYVAFAVDHRNLYRLMFSFPADALVADLAPGPQVKAVLSLVADAFRRPSDLPGISAALRDRVVTAWALAHGLCDLSHSGGIRSRSPTAAKAYIGARLSESGLLRN